MIHRGWVTGNIGEDVCFKSSESMMSVSRVVFTCVWFLHVFGESAFGPTCPTQTLVDHRPIFHQYFPPKKDGPRTRQGNWRGRARSEDFRRSKSRDTPSPRRCSPRRCSPRRGSPRRRTPERHKRDRCAAKGGQGDRDVGYRILYIPYPP